MQTTIENRNENRAFYGEYIEDAMIHREPRKLDNAVREFVKKCGELRERLDKAKTPEEISEIERELDECRKAFEEGRSRG